MLNRELDVALSVVQAAASISRAVQRELVGGWSKDDNSPVTVADLAIQANVSAALTEAFPGDPLMAEEGGEMLQDAERLGLVARYAGLPRSERLQPGDVIDWIERGQKPIEPSQRYWILDPVDGTKGFLRGEQYAIALALVERGEILLGVLGCPNLPRLLSDSSAPLGQMYYAVRGQGAFELPIPEGLPFDRTQSRPIRVSPVENASQATWCERVESSSKNKDLSSQALQLAGISAEPLRLDSQAKYAVVARGEAAVYLRHTLNPDYREKVWDHAAGVIVIEEAGGRVTDLGGRALNFSHGRTLADNRGIVATNARLHDRVLDAVRESLKSA